DATVDVLGRQPGDEGPIDFEAFDGEALEVAEIRVEHPEVVEREVDASAPQGHELCAGFFTQVAVLRDLDPDFRGVEAGAADGGDSVGNEVRILTLRDAHVDVDSQRLAPWQPLPDRELAACLPELPAADLHDGARLRRERDNH